MANKCACCVYIFCDGPVVDRQTAMIVLMMISTTRAMPYYYYMTLSALPFTPSVFLCFLFFAFSFFPPFPKLRVVF